MIASWKSVWATKTLSEKKKGGGAEGVTLVVLW